MIILRLVAQNRQISWLPLKLCVQMLFLSLRIQNIHILSLFFFKFQVTPVHFLLPNCLHIILTKTTLLNKNIITQKLKKCLGMKKEHNTFMGSSLNYNFTIINVICDFFPYPIIEISSGMKRTGKMHLVHHHYWFVCLFFL